MRSSSEPRLDGLDALCSMEGTPTFWSWSGNGNFCLRFYACWGSVGPLGAVSYFACELIIHRSPLWFCARACAYHNLACRVITLVLLCMTFWSCCESLEFVGFFVFSATLVEQPVAFFVLSAFHLFCHTTVWFSPLRALLVIRPIISDSVLSNVSRPGAYVILQIGLCRLRLRDCCFSTMMLLSTYPSRCFRQRFLKIAFNQLTIFCGFIPML